MGVRTESSHCPDRCCYLKSVRTEYHVVRTDARELTDLNSTQSLLETHNEVYNLNKTVSL